MIEDYYICLDATALYFAHKYLADKTSRIMRCYTGREVELVDAAAAADRWISRFQRSHGSRM